MGSIGRLTAPYTQGEVATGRVSFGSCTGILGGIYLHFDYGSCDDLRIPQSINKHFSHTDQHTYSERDC